jgi:hypothetical protein
MLPIQASSLVHGVVPGALGAVAASLRQKWGALSTLGTQHGQQHRQMSAGAPDDVNSFVREVSSDPPNGILPAGRCSRNSSSRTADCASDCAASYKRCKRHQHIL